MIDIGKREPHDEKMPIEVIEHVIAAWHRPGGRGVLSDLITEALTYKAYFEGSESALRWLDPDGDILTRVLNGEVTP